MSTLLSYRLAAIVLVIVLCGTLALAQELDAPWLLGTWQGTSPSPRGQGQEDRRTLIFREGGRFTGDIQSVRGGLIQVSGTYKIEGKELLLEGIYDQAPQAIRGAKFTYSLKRAGDALEGTAYSHATGLTIPVSLKKDK